jgi:hypothetical protein
MLVESCAVVEVAADEREGIKMPNFLSRRDLSFFDDRLPAVIGLALSRFDGWHSVQGKHRSPPTRPIMKFAGE